MTVYASRGQARVQPRDFSAVLRANQLVGAPLAGLERQHSCRAEAELNWLLKRHGVTPNASARRVSLLRQAIGMVRGGVGEPRFAPIRAIHSPLTGLEDLS